MESENLTPEFGAFVDSHEKDLILENYRDQLIELKDSEKQIRAKKKEIFERVCDLVGVPEEGQMTQTIGRFKVKTKREPNRNIKKSELEEVLADLPDDQTAIYFKPELSKSGFKLLKEQDGEAYKILCRAIETTSVRLSAEITFDPRSEN